MLNIAYAPADQALAERLRSDLLSSKLRLENRVLILLAAPESLNDESVMRAVKQAEKDGVRIAVIKVRPVNVPEGLGELPPLDMTQKYAIDRVVAFVNRVDLGLARIRRSQRLLFFIGAGAVIMFAAAIWGITSGNVRFPIEEYATEFAEELSQISTFVAPTLEFVAPRTTQDALNFAATVPAIPTRVRMFAVETATALPLSFAATQQAIETAAVATSAALTQAAPLATPTAR